MATMTWLPSITPEEPSRDPPSLGSLVDSYEEQIKDLLRGCPTMPGTVIAERVGWQHGYSILRMRVGELRPPAVAERRPELPRSQLMNAELDGEVPVNGTIGVWWPRTPRHQGCDSSGKCLMPRNKRGPVQPHDAPLAGSCRRSGPADSALRRLSRRAS